MKAREMANGVRGRAWFNFFGILFLSFLIAGTVCAEDDVQPEKNVFNLGEIVVTAEGDTITKVTSVDTADKSRMELTNATSVSDALETLPGVSISVGRRNEKSINVRGFSEQYVPIFYDGIPMSVPYDGYVDTGKLPTSNLSKITLTKGISSVLYGPNGMGGVVNIISMKPESRFEGDAKIEFREHRTWDTTVNLGSRLNKFYFTAGGGYLDSDGYRLSSSFDSGLNEDGGVRENSDIMQKNGSFKVGFTPSDGHEYALGLNLIDSEWGLPPEVGSSRPKYWRFTDWKKNTYYFIGNSSLSQALKLETRLYRDEYKNVLDAYDDDTYSTQDRGWRSTYDDYSTGGSVVLRTLFIPKTTLSFSFHYKDDVHKAQGDEGEPWERYEQEMFSYGIEADVDLTDTISLVLGTSYDVQSPEDANGGDVRDEDDAVNPQAGVYWQATEQTSLHASVGQKTRFPTLKELFSEYLDGNEPNPDLEKETAINYEVGVNHEFPFKTTIAANLFLSEIDDLIVKKEIAEDVEQNQNIGKARYQGLEIGISSTILDKHTIEAHYTYVDAKDRSSDRTSDHIADVPENQLYISDLFKVSDYISLFGKIQYNTGAYEDDYGEWTRLEDYWLFDAKIIGTLSENFTIEAGASNIFDDDYELSSGYPREGRTFFAALRAKF